ncbi:hypothetical protein GM657_09525 [Lacticaseibacillus rhamnosus GG]|nr:hypothetical protein GM657_09525 [Lacticaseibacillus rhamnosus GG]CAR87792.1 Putative protein without homology [Lacticaseibacillus rhamnosus GG]
MLAPRDNRDSPVDIIQLAQYRLAELNRYFGTFPFNNCALGVQTIAAATHD